MILRKVNTLFLDLLILQGVETRSRGSWDYYFKLALAHDSSCTTQLSTTAGKTIRHTPPKNTSQDPYYYYNDDVFDIVPQPTKNKPMYKLASKSEHCNMKNHASCKKETWRRLGRTTNVSAHLAWCTITPYRKDLVFRIRFPLCIRSVIIDQGDFPRLQKSGHNSFFLTFGLQTLCAHVS